MSKEFVLITGASGGLGKALSEVYSKEGFGLVLLDRNKDSLDSFKKHLNSKNPTHTVVCDLSNWEDCKKAYKQINALDIKIKTLVNNAGVTYIQKFDDDYDINRYQQLIGTNLNGYVYMSKLFIDDLIQNKGSLINISSVIGYAPVIGRTAYAASKYGLEGFFSVLRAELEEKLHLMMVYPTFIATAIRDGSNVNTNGQEVLTATQVAKQIVKSHKAKKKRLFMGKTARRTYYVYKYLPKMYLRIMKKRTKL